jgi:hypothetical protein
LTLPPLSEVGPIRLGTGIAMTAMWLAVPSASSVWWYRLTELLSGLDRMAGETEHLALRQLGLSSLTRPAPDAVIHLDRWIYMIYL